MAEVEEAGKDLNLRAICAELGNCKAKWVEIGIQLGISRGKLLEFKNEPDPLSAVIYYWLNGNVKESVLSWKSIVKALKTGHVGEPGLAEEISKKFCPRESNDDNKFTSDTESEDMPEPKKPRLEIELLVIEAVSNGDRQSLIELISKHHFNVNDTVNDQKETLLHVACRHGNLNIVRTLVEICRCNVEFLDRNGNSPLYVACSCKYVMIVAYLMDQLNLPKANLLEIARQTESLDILRLILRYSLGTGLPLSYNTYDGSILYYLVFGGNTHHFPEWMQAIALNACCCGYLHIIKYLFDLGLFFDELLKSVPRLMVAAGNHQEKSIVKYLDELMRNNPRDGIVSRMNLNYDDIFSNLNRVNSSTITLDSEPALFLPVKSADHSLFECLESAKSLPDLFFDINKNDETLMHAACISGDLSMVKRIYRYLKKDSLNIQNKFGDTCLHIASRWGFLDVIKFLIVEGCQANIKNNNEETPFHLALRSKHIAVFDYFLELDTVNINAATSYGETPLHLSSSFGLLECAEAILAHSKCSLDLQDKLGSTPVMNAVCRGDLKMLQLFVKHNCELFICNKFNETIFHIAC